MTTHVSWRVTVVGSEATAHLWTGPSGANTKLAEGSPYHQSLGTPGPHIPSDTAIWLRPSYPPAKHSCPPFLWKVWQILSVLLVLFNLYHTSNLTYQVWCSWQLQVAPSDPYEMCHMGRCHPLPNLQKGWQMKKKSPNRDDSFLSFFTTFAPWFVFVESSLPV